MTFIPVNLDEAQEQKPAAIGRYNLTVTNAEERVSGENSKRPGSPQFLVNLGFVDEPNVPNISHWISLPHEDDTPAGRNFKMLLLRRFLAVFNIPYDSAGIDTERMVNDMLGATANCEVGLSDPNPKRDNEVTNTLVLPKLRDEETGRGVPPSKKRR
jgi:hypothetical protein